MDLQTKIEIYSAVPYGGEDNKPDEWFHVARNQTDEHVEAVWDIETLFRPDISEENKPTPLLGLESYFEEIILHYALNYTSWKYHDELMIWCLRALKYNGKLQIISPDIDWILRYWLGDAVGTDINKYEFSPEIEQLREENINLKKLVEQQDKTNNKNKSIFRRILSDNKVPTDDVIPVISREEMVVEVPDKVIEDIPVDYDFDLWLMQQLYSSGSGEPQDTFKAVFGKRYLSVLLRRSQFVITLLQNKPDNPKQIEAKAYKHPSRLVTNTPVDDVKIL